MVDGPVTRSSLWDSQLELSAAQPPPPHGPAVSLLYSRSLPSTREGALFNAHSYPTKINVAAVAACILAHTEPDDVVFDGFSGSGVTGLAASLCGQPTIELKEEIESLLGPVSWGYRSAVLYDVSELATFIASALLNPPPVQAFAAAAKKVLESVEADWGWLYDSPAPDGRAGKIRYTIWTDFFSCPNCGHANRYWDHAVRPASQLLVSSASCTNCGGILDATTAPRILEDYWDDLTASFRKRRRREPVYVYGRSGNQLWKRPAAPGDLDAQQRVSDTPPPASVPVVPMGRNSELRWGEMFRSGYHHGISHVHHFYTRRNLLAVGALFDAVQEAPKDLRPALQFWISSYNSSHSTLMTRIVKKQKAKDFVVTSAQPGALYISSLPVEKNVFAGVRAKLATVLEALSTFQGRSNAVSVHCKSSLHVDLPDNSVDYAFTDPPFGRNIQYAEINLINEAWLGRMTRTTEEVIVSPAQGKSLTDYQALLTKALSETHRILKPGRYLTVAFHSTSADVWEALRRAWEEVGFSYVRSTALHKTQTSFKQTTTFGAVRRDPLILLQKESVGISLGSAGRGDADPWDELDRQLAKLSEDDRRALDRHALYSWFIRLHFEKNIAVTWDAAHFFERLSARYPQIETAFDN